MRRAGGGPVLDRFTTHLVLSSPLAPGLQKLRAAVVVPFRAPPALRPNGIRPIETKVSDALAAAVRVLAAHPEIPVVLRPTPETLAALAASPREDDLSSANGLARLARTNQVLAETYVAISPTALVDVGAASEIALQVQRGSEVLEDVLGVRPDPRTRLLDERLDERALAELRDQQVDRLVVPDQSLVPSSSPITLAQPFDLETQQGWRPLTLTSDAGLAAHFNTKLEPVLAANQLLSDLAMIHFESPSLARGVVAVPPPTWRPSAAFLETMLSGLTANPVVEATSLDEVFTAVPEATATRGRPLARRLAPSTAPVPRGGLNSAALQAMRRRVDAFTSVLDRTNPLASDLADAVLVSEGSDLRSGPRKAYLEGVGRQIDGQLSGLQMPRNRTITLTARRGEIPITVLSELGYVVRARLRIDSDQLRFPNGQTHAIDLQRRNTTQVVAVRALSSGAFPLRVRLESPDGKLLLASTRLTVRSTSASGVGVILSVGAAGFLLIWWARHLARGRRNRRLVPA